MVEKGRARGALSSPKATSSPLANREESEALQASEDSKKRRGLKKRDENIEEAPPMVGLTTPHRKERSDLMEETKDPPISLTSGRRGRGQKKNMLAELEDTESEFNHRTYQDE